jgi:hypothetical protein
MTTGPHDDPDMPGASGVRAVRNFVTTYADAAAQLASDLIQALMSG